MLQANNKYVTQTIMAKEPIKISRSVLGSIIPTRNATVASKSILESGEFTVEEVVSRDEAIDTDLTGEKSQDEIGSLSVQLQSPNGIMLTMSLRQFFGLNHVASSVSNADVKKEMKKIKENKVSTVVSPLYSSFLDKDDNDLVFPETVKFVFVEDRKNDNGDTIYPASAYQKFQDRVDLEQAKVDRHNAATGEDTELDIRKIFRDFRFIQSLPSPDAVFVNNTPPTEAQKLLCAVIS